MFELESACICNIGKIRSQNQDNFYFFGTFLPQLNTGLSDTLYFPKASTNNPVAFGVFDGIGGAPNGQYASYLAASEFNTLCLSFHNDASISEFLNQSVYQMNSEVVSKAVHENEGMGTTAVMLGFHNDVISVCNIGDSRAYMLRDENLVQLSNDHTDQSLLEKLGIIGRKPRLQQYIGVRPGEMIIEPYAKQFHLQHDDIYLICSDGITDMLDFAQIHQILSDASSAKNCAEKLRNTALKNGGKDNLTAIIIKVKKVRYEK